MKEKSYSKQIALNFLTATAILIIVIFTSIYFVVHKTVYSRLNKVLDEECQEVSDGIVIVEGQFIFTDQAEWSEWEHVETEVNPVFIQITDMPGNMVKKSANLIETSLPVLKNKNRKIFFNSALSTGRVRQVQMPLINESNEQAGYVTIAVPLEESQIVVKNLLLVLLSAFPVVLVVLYFVTRFIAQRSIGPVKTLTGSAAKISRENMNERISLPQRKDELYTLTETINSLLDRVEDAVMHEKQFSSDASHELRTPLAVLKGTLELMVRKPRDTAYYIEKTGTCLEEVNRMSVLVDQLLLLARYEKEVSPLTLALTNLPDLMNNIIVRHANDLEKKGISLYLNIHEDLAVLTDAFMAEQILENIFSNALKYSYANSTIGIFSNNTDHQTSLTIKDEGIGMNKEELSQIFERFYRADQSRSFLVKGYGLGLAIARRFADLLQIIIRVESQPRKGSAFTLVFPGSPEKDLNEF